MKLCAKCSGVAFAAPLPPSMSPLYQFFCEHNLNASGLASVLAPILASVLGRAPGQLVDGTKGAKTKVVRMRLTMQMIGQIVVMTLLTSPGLAGPQFVDGAALSGYDAVAYQDQGAAIHGETTITTDWNGATWRFATPAHLALFRADPARYAPAYDGHCAYAVSEGRKSGGMPELWQVAGGHLYLLCSKSAFEKWTSEFDTRLARANANWVTLEALPAAHPKLPPPATP